MTLKQAIARTAIALIAAMPVGGCVNYREFADFQGLAIPGLQAARTDPFLQLTNLDEYRLDSGDHLRVTVFGQTDLTGEYTVDGSGTIALPLIMPMPAKGMTTDELAHSLEGALGQRLLRNPSVSIEVTQYRPFFILGEVNQPGQYAYVNGMTVRTAAAIAGGFTYRASGSSVKITRRTNQGVFEGTATSEANIMPGDTIVVGERLF